MSGRIFQNVVLQLKETTDKVIGVIDTEGTVVACSELSGIGKKWPEYVPAINSAEGAAIVLDGKTFKALAGWGARFDTPCLPVGRTASAALCAPWPLWH